MLFCPLQIDYRCQISYLDLIQSGSLISQKLCDIEVFLTLIDVRLLLELFGRDNHLLNTLVIKILERQCQVVTGESVTEERPWKFYNENRCIKKWPDHLLDRESGAALFILAWLIVREDVVWVGEIVQICLNLICIQV